MRRLCFYLCASVTLALLPAYAPMPGGAPPRVEGEVVTGRVTDANGNPLRRAVVRVFSADGSDTLSVRAFTDADGRYRVTLGQTVAVDPEGPVPTDYALDPVSPNPLSASTASEVWVTYTTPGHRADAPTVELYDTIGRRVYGDVLAAGVYHYRLRFASGHRTATRALVVAEGGPVTFTPVRRGTTPGKAASLGKTGAARDVLVRIEKAGYVRQEKAANVDAAQPTTVDAALAVAPAPVASFRTLGTLQALGVTRFDATASVSPDGGALTYTWTFGNGQQGGGPQIVHRYKEAGTYTVTLTVASQYGALATATQTVTITALPAPTSTAGVLDGRVTERQTVGLAGVAVTHVGTGKTTTTDADGAFRLAGLPTGTDQTFTFTRDGYATQQVRTTIPTETKQATVFRALVPRAAPVTLARVEDGVGMRAKDGAIVEIPPDALVRPDGTPATGAVEALVTPLDVLDAPYAFPGRFEGVTPTGDEGVILSYGVSEYAFEQNGETLQLAPGTKATIEVPVYTGGAAVGDEIPLWSVDEETGLWIQEGVGTIVQNPDSPTGLAMRAEVGHFSWWNCDDFDAGGDARPGPGNDGPCYRNECSTGVCQRVAVGCWTSGARRGSAKNLTRDDQLPVFEVRQFLPAGFSGSLKIPANRDVLFAATAVDDRGELLYGETTVRVGRDSTALFSIELKSGTPSITNSGPIAIGQPLNGELKAGEFNAYTFTVGSDAPVLLLSYESPGPDLLVTVTGPDGNLYVRIPEPTTSTTPDRASQLFVARAPGTYTVLVAGADAGQQGLFQLAVESVATLPLDAYGDSTRVTLADQRLGGFRFDGQKGDVVRVRVRYIEGEGGAAAYALALVGPGRILEQSESSVNGGLFQQQMIYILPETGTYAAVMARTTRTTGTMRLDVEKLDLTPEVVPVDSSRATTLTFTDRAEVRLVTFTTAAGQALDVPIQPVRTYADVRLFDGDDRLVAGGRLSSSSRNPRSVRYTRDTTRAETYRVLFYRADGVSPGTLQDGAEYASLYPEAYTYVPASGVLTGTLSAPTELPRIALRLEPGQTYNFGLEAARGLSVGFNSLIRLGGTGLIRPIVNEDYTGFLRRDEGGVYVGDLRVQGTVGQTYTVRLAPATEQRLPLDAAGEAVVSARVGVPGALARYTFDAAAGDGFVATIRRTEAALGNLSLRLTRESATRTTDDVQLSAPYALLLDAQSLPLGGDTLLYVALKMPHTDRYRLDVFDDSLKHTGDYALEALLLPSGSYFVAEGDAACAGATTPSLAAALAAVNDGGEVVACAGTHTQLAPYFAPAASVTLRGQGRDATRLAPVRYEPRFRSFENALDVALGLASGATVRDLTVDFYNDRGIGLGTFGSGAIDDLALRNVRFTTRRTSGAYAVSNVGTPFSADSLLVEAPFAFSRSGGYWESVAITNSTFAVQQALALNNTRGTVVVEGNTIRATPSSSSVTAVEISGQGNVRVARNTVTTTAGDAVEIDGYGGTLEIVENDFDGARYGVILRSARTGRMVHFERNRVEGRQYRAFSALGAAGSDSLLIRNNVFVGVDRAAEFTRTEGFAALYLVNNTFAVDSSSAASPDGVLVQFTSGQTNAGPFVLVNNLVAGKGTGRGVFVQNGTLVAGALVDYNLVSSFATPYVGATAGPNDASGAPNLAGRDRRLGAGSAALDAGAGVGVSTWVPQVDKRGRSRPQGPAEDIGAHEGVD